MLKKTNQDGSYVEAHCFYFTISRPMVSVGWNLESYDSQAVLTSEKSRSRFHHDSNFDRVVVVNNPDSILVSGSRAVFSDAGIKASPKGLRQIVEEFALANDPQFAGFVFVNQDISW